MRTEAQLAGDAAEAAVVAALTGAGWSVVGRNVRVGRAELDLIARDPGPPQTLVFVEVRWRGRRDFGLPEETVDRRKRTRLHQAAWTWIGRSGSPRLPLRFDLIVVEPGEGSGRPRIRHHRGAF